MNTEVLYNVPVHACSILINCYETLIHSLITMLIKAIKYMKNWANFNLKLYIAIFINFAVAGAELSR